MLYAVKLYMPACERPANKVRSEPVKYRYVTLSVKTQLREPSKAMSKIEIIVKWNDARYLRIWFLDFNLVFTERVTYVFCSTAVQI